MRYAKLAAACLPGVFAPLAVAGDQGIILVGNGGLIDGSTNMVYVEAHISDQLAGNLYRCEIPDVELTPPDYMLFDGWYSQPSGGMRYPGAEITVPAGSWRNVYAHWRYDTYEVAYSETGGDADLRTQVATNGIPAYAEECQTEDSGVMRFVGWVDGNGANHRPGELLDKSMEGDVLTALWEYNVEFAANGGNPAATNVWLKKTDNLPTVSSLFARKGYRFANWALASDGSGGKYENQSRFGDIFEGGWIAGEDVLYAQWTANKYSAIYQAGGGSVRTGSVDVVYGSPYGRLETPVRDGYAFDGWFLDDRSFKRQVVASTVVATDANHNLYAQWTPVDVVVRFDANGGYVPVPAKTVAFGKTYGDLPRAQRPGYTQTGWFDSAAGGNRIASTNTVSMSSPRRLYAQWSVNRYSVVCRSDNRETKRFDVDYGGRYEDLDDPEARDGYVFLGWFTEKEGGVKVERADSHDLAGGCVLYAHWAPLVTFDPAGGEVEPDRVAIEKGRPYGEMPVPERKGFLFDGWYTKQSGGEQVLHDTIMESPAPSTLYARWTAAAIVVKFDAGTDGYVATAAKSVAFAGKYGDLPVPVREGYAFVRWSDGFGNDIDRLTTVAIPSNHWLRASWAPRKYMVVFDSDGGSAQDAIEVEFGKPSGDLPAPAKVGCRFAGWTDQDGEVVDGVFFGSAGDVVLTARWDPITYPVRFHASGGEGTMADQIFLYDEAQTLSPNSFEKDGSVFVGWSTNGDDTVSYRDGDLFLSRAADGTVYDMTAVWDGKRYPVSYVDNGSAIFSTNLLYGAEYGEMPVPPERAHYDFAGWFTERVGGYWVRSNSVVSVAGGHELYSHWRAKEKDAGFGNAIADERIYCESVGDGPKWHVSGNVMIAPDGYPDNSEPAELKLYFNSDCGGTLSFWWMLEHDAPIPGEDKQHFTVGPLKLKERPTFVPGYKDEPPYYDNWYETNIVVSAGEREIVFAFDPDGLQWDAPEFNGNIRANVSNIVFREWERIDLPAAETGLVFDGLAQTGVVEGVGFILTGNVATNAGEYTAKATLDAGNAWNRIGGTGEQDIKWSIAPKIVDVAPEVEFADIVFTYDAKVKKNEFEIPGSLTEDCGRIDVSFDYCTNNAAGGLIVLGSSGVSEVGEYVVVAKLSFAEDTGNYRLAETNLFAKLTILDMSSKVEKPSARENIVYTGSMIEGVGGGYGYVLTGNVATNAGEYVATAKLDAGFVWADGSPEVLEIPWSIAKARYDMSDVVAGDAVFDYDGTAKLLNVANLPDGVVASCNGDGRCEAGVYAVEVEFFGDWTNYEYVAPTNFTLTVKPVPAAPDSRIPVAVPAPVAGLLYDGLCKTGVVESAGFTLAGNVATNAGEHVATARLSDGYKWSDGSAEDMQIKWSIARAEHDISGVGGLGYFAYDGTDKTFSLTNLPDGVVAVYSGNIQSEPDIYEVKVDFIVDETNYLPIAARTYTLEVSEEVEKPETAQERFVYSGVATTGVVESAGFTLTGNVATNAGEYVAVAKLKNGYRWADGSLGDEEIPWTIAKAVYDMGGVLFPDGEYGFDGEPKSLAVEGPLPAGVAVSYSGNGQTEPGVYEIEAAFSGDGANYEPIPPMKAKLTIVAADPSPEGELFPVEESLGEFDASQAFTYNGWLKDADGKIAGAITVKTGKAKAGKNSKVTISYTLLGGKKTTVRTEIAPGGKPVDESGIVYGALGLSGSFKGYTVEAAKDLTKSKIAAEKALAGKYPAGVWTFAFDTGSGYAGFSATLAKKGKAKISGYLPDGTKISVSAQGALGETAFAVPCAYSKKNVSFGFVLWLPLDGTPASVVDVSAGGWECEKGAAHTTLADGTLRLLMEIPAFREYIGELDGFDLLPSTFTVRNGKILREKTVGKVKAKDGDPYVDYRAGQTPANLPALKLACAAKTGLVSGSFKLYYLSGGRLKTDTVTVRGVMSGGEFFGSGAVKKQGAFAIAGE